MGRGRRLLAVVTAAGLVFTACRDDAPDSTGSTTPTTTDAQEVATTDRDLGTTTDRETDTTTDHETERTNGRRETTETTETTDTTNATDSTDTTDSADATDTTTTTGDPTNRRSGPADRRAGCPGPAADGTPVRVGVTWPEGATIDLPELGEAAQAAADFATECLDGIAGRPIELVTCTLDGAGPAAGTECADELVDADVVAAVVTIAAASQRQAMVPVLTGAGVPYVTASAASADENNNDHDLVFVLTAGLAGTLGGMARTASDDGITKVRLMVPEIAAGGVEALAQIPFGAVGVEVEIVSVPPGTSTLTRQVTTGSTGSDAIGIIGDPTLCISWLEAVAEVDPDGERYVIAPCLDPSVIDAAGDALDGAVVFEASEISGDDPEAELYRWVMERYAPNTPTGGVTVTAYQGVLGLVRGLADIDGAVTADTVAQTMRATTLIDIPAGAGTTYGCARDPFPLVSAVCAGETIVATVDGTTPSDPHVVDAASLFLG